MDIEKFKTNKYKKNENLEHLLKTLNSVLELTKNYKFDVKEKYPILFIVGTPRSGTTLLTQWLASLGLFCYPSNFISRFYKAPFVGALIQEMLVNPVYSYKKEFAYDNSFSYNSDTGKTSGITEPHEFWYFWRQFFEFPSIPTENNEFIKKADFLGFQQEIYRLQQVYKKPFFLKSLIMNWYIESFSQNIENPIFLYIKRDPIANMGSLLKTRERYLGDRNIWFSFKPREYDLIKNEDNFIKVAGQVFFTNNTIENSLSTIPKEQQLLISYEEFCSNPFSIYTEIIELLHMNKYFVKKKYHGPEKFKLPDNNYEILREKLFNAYSYVQNLI